MKILAKQNRELIMINAQNTQNENDAEKITLQVPEQYEDFNKKIVFVTPDGNVWDIITNNEYLIKKAITKYKQVDFYIWLTKGDVDFRSQTKTLKFYHNLDASDEITDEEIGRVNTVINLLEEEITKVENLESQIDGKLEEIDTAITNVNTAIQETENLNLDAEKVGQTTTVTLTKKDGTVKTIHIDDGVDLQFMWQGTSLGIKTEDQQEYTFVDLQGATGPVGPTGNGISSITKTGTSGLVDTYTITYTNGNTTTFTITNGKYDDSYIKENIQTNATNIANNTKNIAKKANSTINNNVDVLETTKSTESIGDNQLFFNKGAIFGGTAMDAGLVTRGICGITTPDSKGGCAKENLYVNYDGGSDYNANRQLVIQAGNVGSHYGNNLYQFAAARGDAVKGYVDKAISSAVKGKYTKPETGIPKTDLAGTVQTSLEKADTAIQSSNFVYDSTTQTLTITTV